MSTLAQPPPLIQCIGGPLNGRTVSRLLGWEFDHEDPPGTYRLARTSLGTYLYLWRRVTSPLPEA